VVVSKGKKRGKDYEFSTKNARLSDSLSKKKDGMQNKGMTKKRKKSEG